MCADGWLYNWQTLIGAVIAGLLAIGAAGLGGWMAYRAARDAARGQIQALEGQNADLKLAERRRLARERSAVARILYASAGIVESGIHTALHKVGSCGSTPDEPTANYIRRSVRKRSFDYLRERVGNLEREDIVVDFLLLEAGIDQLWPEEGAAQRDQLKTQLDDLLKKVQTLHGHALQELEGAITEVRRLP